VLDEAPSDARPRDTVVWRASAILAPIASCLVAPGAHLIAKAMQNFRFAAFPRRPRPFPVSVVAVRGRKCRWLGGCEPFSQRLGVGIRAIGLWVCDEIYRGKFRPEPICRVRFVRWIESGSSVQWATLLPAGKAEATSRTFATGVTRRTMKTIRSIDHAVFCRSLCL